MPDKLIIKNLTGTQLKEALAHYILEKARPGYVGACVVNDSYETRIVNAARQIVGVRVEIQLPE
jgi:hypothetical protein